MLTDNRNVEKLLLDLVKGLKRERAKRERFSNFKYTLEEKNKRIVQLQKQFEKFMKDGDKLLQKEIKRIQKDRLNFEIAMTKNEKNQKMADDFFNKKLKQVQSREKNLITLLKDISEAIEGIGD